MAKDETADQLIDQLLKSGVSGLLEVAEVRAQCEIAARDLGCVPPTNKIVIALMAQFAGYSQGLASEWARSALVRLAERWPALRAFLARLLAIEAACRDKDQLRRFLLAELRGEAADMPAPVADHGSSVEMLRFLWDRDAFAGLDAAMREAFGGLAGDLQRRFTDIYEPVLSDKAASREAARFGAESGRAMDSLIYTAEWDELRGREEDLDFLQGFLGSADAASGWNRFRWQLLTGDAGEGKSRLALHFRDVAASQSWHAGFLDHAELEKIDPRRWRPRMRTLLIIDYAAEVGDRVAALIASCAENAAQFDFAVRILLLERSAEGVWYQKLTPKDSNGPLIERARFAEPRALSPLPMEHIARLMIRRLPHLKGTYDESLELARRLLDIDRRKLIDAQGEKTPIPRPLYAAALAEFMAMEADNPDAVIAGTTREKVFDGLLHRERQHYWQEPDARAPLDRRLSFTKHLNLLVLTTMVRGIELPIPTEKASLLPDMFPSLSKGSLDLDIDQYRRMSRQGQRRQLAPLEPDLLGEYFVIAHLMSLAETGAHLTIIEAALDLGDNGVVEFIYRACVDFPELAEKLAFFACGPEASDKCLTVYLIAQANMALLLPSHAARDYAGAMVRMARKLVKDRIDEDRVIGLAHGALNLSANYLRTGQLTKAHEQIDWLFAFYKKRGDHAILGYLLYACNFLFVHSQNDAASAKSLALLERMKGVADLASDPPTTRMVTLLAYSVVERLAELGKIKAAEQHVRWMVEKAPLVEKPEIIEDIARAVYRVFKVCVKLKNETAALRLYAQFTKLRLAVGGEFVVMGAGLCAINMVWFHAAAGRTAEAEAEYYWLREEAERTGKSEIWTLASAAAFNMFIAGAQSTLMTGRRQEIEWLRDVALNSLAPHDLLHAARASLWAMIIYQVCGDEQSAMGDRLWIAQAAREHPQNRELCDLDQTIDDADIVGWSTRQPMAVLGTKALNPALDGVPFDAIKKHPLEHVIGDLFAVQTDLSQLD